MILEKLKSLVEKGLLTEEELELIKSGKFEESNDLPKVDEEVVVEDTPKEEAVEEEVKDDAVPEESKEEVKEDLPEEVTEEQPVEEPVDEELVEEQPTENPTEEISELDQNPQEEELEDAKIAELENRIKEQDKVIEGLNAKVESLLDIVSKLSVTQEVDKNDDFGITQRPDIQKHEEVEVESILTRMNELSSR